MRRLAPRLLVVSGGDYAALKFANNFDVDKMTPKQIRDLVDSPNKWDGWREMQIVEIEGPCNRALYRATVNAIQDYDDSKHTDAWYFEEEEEESEEEDSSEDEKQKAQERLKRRRECRHVWEKTTDDRRVCTFCDLKQ